MTRDMWLSERRNGIGGSDAAALLGLNPYSSPYIVWADKLGILPEREDTEAMRQGRDFEAVAANRFREETGLNVRRCRQILRNHKYPYSHANIDRRIVGARAGLEIKTCSPYRIKEFDDNIYPAEYYVQCLHYLAVTGWEEWYLAVLILGTDFKIFKLEREKELKNIEEAQRVVTEFWEAYVLTKTPPPPDGSDATSRAIASVHKTAVDGSVDLSSMEDEFVQIAALNEQLRAIERDREQHRQTIKIAMGEATRAECSAWVANWKPRKDGTRVFSIKEKQGA